MLAMKSHPGRTGRSKATTVAIGFSIAAHAGLFAYLYYQRIELQAPPRDEPPPIEGILWMRPPPPPPPPPAEKPPEAPQSAPRTPVREAAPPTQPVERSPIAPYDGEIIESEGPPVLEDIPPGPVFQPVPAPPAPPSPPAPAAAGPSVITRPNWLSRPSGEQMARYYPKRALEREIGGRAVLSCQVTSGGQVTACTVAGETPAGAGFGDAALKLARYFRMSPRTEDGRPMEGGTVRVPLEFRLGD